MLTLILLVVLGGGAGLMAVWLIDARGLSRLVRRGGGGSLRRPRRRGTTPPSPVADPVATSAGPSLAPVGGGTAVAYEPIQVPPDPAPALPEAGRGRSTKVPAAYTAVEGSYRDVARVPVWRKLVSLVSLLAILAVIGVAVAALAGATFGAAAELVDSAVG